MKPILVAALVGAGQEGWSVWATDRTEQGEVDLWVIAPDRTGADNPPDDPALDRFPDWGP